MKRLKSIQMAIICLLATTILTYSCKQNDSLQITETVNNYPSKQTILNLKSIISSNETTPTPQQAIVQSQLSLNLNIPSAITESELTNYVNQNISNINGEIVFKVNGEIFYKSIITNGVENIIIGVPNSSGGLENECSFAGVIECAKKTLYALGTVGKIVCAFGMQSCYTVAAADCIEKNCINSGIPAIPFDVTTETPNSGTDPGGVDIPHFKIPNIGIDNFKFGESLVRIEMIISGRTPAHSTKIFSNNNLYYSDVNFTCILPSGFYTNNDSSVYEIVNGVCIDTRVIASCVTCPYPTLPPLNNPFNGCGLPSGPVPTPVPNL
ncbi:hypothetical protein KO02_19970 [Sphingobacterium sp. ML3W]|nr:hypothetical protein KO02_19970 [Sphingobacterium sp. ML3W]